MFGCEMNFYLYTAKLCCGGHTGWLRLTTCIKRICYVMLHVTSTLMDFYLALAQLLLISMYDNTVKSSKELSTSFF